MFFFSAGVVDHWPQTFDVVQFLLSDIYASCFGVLDSAPFDFWEMISLCVSSWKITMFLFADDYDCICYYFLFLLLRLFLDIA
jgi:hypothetical protein